MSAYEATVSNCLISNNTSVAEGGGVSMENSTVTCCQITDNSSDYIGGGIYALNSTISNSLIANNSADNSAAGGVFANNTNIISTTIVRNSAYYDAGVSGNCDLVNSIVWGNGTDMYNNISYYGVNCSYSAIEGWYNDGEGIIHLGEYYGEYTSPLFVNPSSTVGASDATSNVDWHLQQGSPCVNSGNNAAVTESLDLDGTARIKRDTVDLGCYESDYNKIEPCTDVIYYVFSQSACDSFQWNDQIYYYSGLKVQTFISNNGCDSIVTLNLTINHSTTSDTTAIVCNSIDWYEYNNLTRSGDYTRMLTNINGCDSVVTLHLTVNQPTTSIDVQTACGSYTWIDGVTYTESNNSATYTLTNAVGCDSVVTLNLTINQPTTGTDVQTACGSYTWIDGNTYNESNNTATFTLTNSAGCDSVVTLNLTINQPTTGTDVQAACGSFTWIDGITYTQSNNTATYTLTNAAGCDSIVTLNLTINYSTHNVETETVCESFTWHGATYTTSGTFTYEYTNASGCASVDTLYLTVNYGTHNVETETACESFTWHGTEYTATGTYTYEYTNASGCASADTLKLTINQPVAELVEATACDSYEWNGTTYTETGDYTQTFIAANGCDSVVTLHLTINPSVTEEIEVSTTDSCYTWNSQSYCTSGTYTQTLQTVHGCDSVVTMHLTITVGIDDHDLGASMTVYPNPTNDIVNVQITNHNSPITQIHVFDAYGKLVGVVETRCTTSLQTAQIDLSRYAPGVYFVKAVADDKVVAVRKVVKR